jgi:dihydropteroate synthase
MNSLTDYRDVAAEVVAELTGVRDKLYSAGVAPEQIIVDPGLGFAKDDVQNWELLQHLDVLQAMGHKVLVGGSRKRFLGSLLTVAGKAAQPAERDAATAALTAVSAFRGAWAVRVHDVGASLDAVKVAARMVPPTSPATAAAAGTN